MADENMNDEQGEEKLWTNADIADKVKKRVKNLHSDNEGLKDRIAELEAQQAAPVPTPSVQESAPLAAGNAAPEPQTQEGPLTAQSMQTIMDNQYQKSQAASQQQQFQQAHQYHVNNLATLKNEDEKFRKLEATTSLGIPEEVAIHLSNNFKPDVAKKIFTELLSNESSNLKMNNAFLSNKYGDWVKKLMENPGADVAAPEPVPELGREANSSAVGNSDDNIKDYMSKL